MARAFGVGLLLVAALLLGALWVFQGLLIYPAPHYSANELENLPPGLIALRDPLNPASVVGFYRPPLGGGAPRKLWLAFGGNGDLALHWDAVLARSATTDVGFLLVEYPGYGARAGNPSPESLLTGTEATLQALAAHLGSSARELEAR